MKSNLAIKNLLSKMKTKLSVIIVVVFILSLLRWKLVNKMKAIEQNTQPHHKTSPPLGGNENGVFCSPLFYCFDYNGLSWRDFWILIEMDQRKLKAFRMI